MLCFFLRLVKPIEVVMNEKIKSVRNKVFGLGALVLPASALASSTSFPSWWPSDMEDADDVFGSSVYAGAVIGIGVVAMVAGVRVCIKLLNRGAGK